MLATQESHFSDYLLTLYDAAVFTSGKVADIALAYNNELIVVFDLTSTQADNMDHVNTLIEGLKNGRLFSPKYDSQIKLFATPHAVVFANWIFDDHDRHSKWIFDDHDGHSKLSRDCWVVHEL